MQLWITKKQITNSLTRCLIELILRSRQQGIKKLVSSIKGKDKPSIPTK
jgi:hypothetical protein